MNNRPLHEKLKTLFDNEEETVDTICSAIAGGGTAVDLCKLWGVPYGTVMNWMRKDRTRTRRHTEAINDRGDWIVESVLEELRKMAMVDVRGCYDADSKLLPVKEWPEDLARSVASVDKKGTVKFHSKLKAIELLGKNLDIFRERLEVTGRVTLEDIVGGTSVGEDSDS
ncbi:MAG: hypothetical protein DRN30_00730 [Thermoplasmata archaeon]|nr:MAG: hypothetical protein DRN30_00730 [Thermoplasmata archaeon]